MEETNKEECSELVLVEEEKRGRGRPKGTFKKTVDKSGFLKAGGHEFEKIVKKTEKDMIDIMNTLATIVSDSNSSNSEKIKAADIFTANYTKMVDQMNKDEIVRKEKEITVRGSVGVGDVEEEEEEGPMLDFNNISEEFKDVPQIEQTILDKKD